MTARLKKVRCSAGVTSGQLNCQTTYLTAQAILNAFWGWNGAHYKCGNACNFKTTLPDQSGALPALEGKLPSSPAVTGNPDLELWLLRHSTRPGRINTLAYTSSQALFSKKAKLFCQPCLFAPQARRPPTQPSAYPGLVLRTGEARTPALPFLCLAGLEVFSN